MIALPPALLSLVDTLATLPGAVAVVLGGSRATGAGDVHSDWDLGLYYRGDLDTRALTPYGTVYPPGVPTYFLLAERALSVVLRGHLPDAGDYPAKLAETAPPRWRFHRRFSVEYARMHAARGDVVGAVGQATKAILEEAHAILSARRRWVLNEKRMVALADLTPMHARFEAVPRDPPALTRWVHDLAAALDDPAQGALW